MQIMPEKIELVFAQNRYRCFTMEDHKTVIYYKYYEEGFHVVLVRYLEYGTLISAEEHSILENRVLDLLYHPVGRLKDFPEGFPVYHVEVLTLLIGDDIEQMRMLCSSIQNAWAYLIPEGRLYVYENQPGDFWGLRSVIESEMTEHTEQSQKRGSFWDSVKNFQNLSYITIGIAALNILIFLYLEFIGDTRDALFIEAHGGMYPDDILYGGEWWRILTACFLHFGAGHLMNNMVIFCCVGSRLERAVGHLKFLTIYLLSGIGGGMLSYHMMLKTGEFAVSAGASGAVFGTIGGLLWAVLLHRGCFEGLTTKGLILMSALSLYYGFVTMGVDNWGHIGGMITGLLVSIILCHRKRQKY